MTDLNLFPKEAKYLPRAAWQVIDAARSQRMTGELTLDLNPAVRVYLLNGFVYFAETEADRPLAARLVGEGVISPDQLQQGEVVFGDMHHLGRLFDRDISIDRTAVELCVELFTEDVLSAIAADTVAAYSVRLYRRHNSGIDRWHDGHAGVPAAVPHTAPAVVATQPSAVRPAVADVASISAFLALDNIVEGTPRVAEVVTNRDVTPSVAAQVTASLDAVLDRSFAAFQAATRAVTPVRRKATPLARPFFPDFRLSATA
jgi:hypothetical protein